MRYQYSRLHADTHRDVAHWRGARSGVRVLSLPTCSAWLQRQANDDCYDFWPDLAIGNHLPAQQGPTPPVSLLPESAAATFIMHKDADGAWFIDPWQGDSPDAMRPQAANGDKGAAPLAAVSRDMYQMAALKSPGISQAGAPASPQTAAQQPHEQDQEQHQQHGATSFIIEIGNRLA